MLPGTDGFALCRAARERSDAPILFVTAREDEQDKLHGYGLGADDYVVKPFSLAVLYAKAQALLRRARGLNAGEALTAGALSLDPARGLVTADGRRIDLACGAQIVFERTEAMWTVAVRRTQVDASVSTVDAEAAQAVIEALLEFDVRGIVAVALLEGLPLDAFNDLIDNMSDGLSDGKTRISGDASLSVALIERGRRTI